MTPGQTALLRRVYTVARIALLSAILVYLVSKIYAGRTALSTLGERLSFVGLLAALVTAVLAYHALLFGWIMLLRRAGYYRSGQLTSYARIWWVSYLYRYVPGKVLLLVERARLGSEVGIPHSVGAALPIIETVLAVLAGSTVALLAALHYVGSSTNLLTTLGVLIVSVVVLAPLVVRLIIRMPILNQKFPQLESIRLRSVDMPIVALPFLLHYLLIGTSFFLTARAVYPLAWSDMPGFVGVYALSHVVGLVAVFAPGGLGVREGALALQLDKSLPAGIAGTLALGARLWFTGIEVLCFGVTQLLDTTVAKRNRRQDEPKSGRD